MKQKIKICIDVVMVALLPILMAEIIVGQKLHEWLGLLMIIAFIGHHILNINWIKNILRGRYTATRAFLTSINILLLVVMILLAVSGIMMSGYVFSWLNIHSGMIIARKLHLAMSFWGLIIMSLHLGVHMGMLVRKMDKLQKRIGVFFLIVICILGVYSFVSQNVADYLFLKQVFMFYDYNTPISIFYAEYISIIVLFAAIGYHINKALGSKKIANKITSFVIKFSNNKLLHLLIFSIAVVAVVNGGRTVENNELEKTETEEIEVADITEPTPDNNSEAIIQDIDINDSLIKINGGIFLMGSPESEDWRSEDETQHEVTVSDFYISAYEVTQGEYAEIMGDNPSTFSGEKLPVENVSWIDAVTYCNALSIKRGLTPAYTITDEAIVWDRQANGYRLPTEAEWEYACRAGTTTPFNTENYIGAEECNFYGHYPYMIEGNYFNQSVLTTKPGVYRETTVDVGSFSPNAWGLYDCHGNVGEWVWDFYGEYDLDDTINPTGSPNGTMHISRGGGWNDFGKNLRSAYRATSQNGMAAYNVGFRIARGAVIGADVVNAENEIEGNNNTDGNMLIVYFSWSGNTRGIAKEIQRQTGADIFEIELTTPYSTDYSTVLEQAQHDQNIQARPEIIGHIDNMDDYDIIFIGYPNWWASIPMPIASFLDEYDLSGKTIMPFCSHGGGRFGQSLTAIAKLEPNAIMAEGLSVHYSGGSELASDVADWLKLNGIN
jgi:formylglycine-generating enzyme required for sulfatase activity/flavodoxin